MIEIEVELFYKNNSENYILESNDKFLLWLEKRSKEQGYNPIMNNKDLQSFINDLTIGYENRYSEVYFDYIENILDSDPIKIPKKLDCIQIMDLIKYVYNLALLNCDYR